MYTVYVLSLPNQRKPQSFGACDLKVRIKLFWSAQDAARTLYSVARCCAHELTAATVFRHAYVPHTCPHIPCSLRDDSPVVRKNTLVVLTHLILNDMIKVKGQISAMALCLEDPEQKIADLAKLFFHELSKKVSICTHLKLPNQYT